MLKIHEKGFWIDNKLKGKKVDPSLAEAISKTFKNKEQSFVDFGCGNGFYTKYLIENDITNGEAYDGNPHTEEVTDGLGKVLDLSEPVYLRKSFDVVLSLEVGEHIPSQYEETFMNNIIRHAKYKIILSWAVEGQIGRGHVNCRNNDYIIDKFHQLSDFRYQHSESMELRKSVSCCHWFKNTLMMFKKREDSD